MDFKKVMIYNTIESNCSGVPKCIENKKIKKGKIGKEQTRGTTMMVNLSYTQVQGFIEHLQYDPKLFYIMTNTYSDIEWLNNKICVQRKNNQNI